ncbi:MAG: hypothetical protein OK439_00305 [Thaumarchaeota archaeon]|nr:hypothetical protein [Nitrososphaerota archaeon]
MEVKEDGFRWRFDYSLVSLFVNLTGVGTGLAHDPKNFLEPNRLQREYIENAIDSQIMTQKLCQKHKGMKVVYDPQKWANRSAPTTLYSHTFSG